MAIWAWRGIFRPMLTYGCIVWGHRIKASWVQDKLKTLQSKAFQLMSFYRKSTPIKGLEMITNTWPLDLFIKSLQAAAFFRTRGFECHDSREMYTGVDGLKGHRQHIEEWIYTLGVDAHKLLSVEVDDVCRRFMWNHKYEVDENSWGGGPNAGKPTLDSKFAIYTDGSTENGISGGGLAFFIRTQADNGELVEKEISDPNNRHWYHFHLGENSTFAAEMYSLGKAAQLVQLLNLPQFRGETLTIYSDSQAAVKALHGCETKSELVFKTFEALNRTSDLLGIKIIIRWVKGHAGHLGNELADKNANIGRVNTDYRVIDPPKITFKKVKFIINSGLIQLWNTRWVTATDTRQTREWFPTGVNAPLSAQLVMEKRTKLSKYIILMSGHNYMRRHSYIVRFTEYQRGRLE